MRERALGYVVADAASHRLTTGIGARRAVDLAVRPHLRWHRLSARGGTPGHRWYDWALIDQHRGHHALLIRRNRTSGELAFYRTWTPVPASLQTLVTVAGRRWTIEEAFQTGKGLTGLDAHQVRRWTSWRLWTLLAMLAHAILTVLAVTSAPAPSTSPSPAPKQGDDHDRSPALVPLTRNEIQHLITALTIPVRAGVDHALAWSFRRRKIQARARDSHYRRTSRHHQMITKSGSSIKSRDVRHVRSST